MTGADPSGESALGRCVTQGLRLLTALVRTGNTTTLRALLTDALPWSVFLPDEDAETMLTELADTARGAAALENLAPIVLLLTQWQHTAEVYADPALHAALTREPEADLGPVPAPAGPGEPETR